MGDRAAADEMACSALEEAVAEPAYRLRVSLTAIVGFAELLRTRDSEHVRREAPLRIQEAAEALLRELDDPSALQGGKPALAHGAGFPRERTASSG
jgi:signal transduction histidine kinase